MTVEVYVEFEQVVTSTAYLPDGERFMVGVRKTLRDDPRTEREVAWSFPKTFSSGFLPL
ncbi:MAG: hypothetical protein U5N86_06900 [Planctomycetota bacterium]|nr:hypothetical protein [Planctomycetota bacterium]